MNFILLKVDNPKKLKSLSKNKINFFRKDEDVSIFHYNQMDNGLFHVVFNISDEYVVSTKKLGHQHNFTYSSLSNYFFKLETNYTILEYINNEYLDEVLNEIRKKTKSIISIVEINNGHFLDIYDNLKGKIKKLAYTNQDEEFVELENINQGTLQKISEENLIDSITFFFDNQYVSIKANGKISVDNSNQEYLVGFIERVLNALN